jgi:c-di-GMP-related signal transduction protein
MQLKIFGITGEYAICHGDGHILYDHPGEIVELSFVGVRVFHFSFFRIFFSQLIKEFSLVDVKAAELTSFVPPLFSEVRKSLKRDIEEYIDTLSISQEQKHELIKYYEKVWVLVDSGEISLELDFHAEVLNVKILRIVSKLCIGIGDTKFDQLMTLFSIDNGFYLGKTQRL